MAVNAPPIDSVQNVLRTFGSGSKLDDLDKNNHVVKQMSWKLQVCSYKCTEFVVNETTIN